jgi:hypothetical protein
MAPEDLPVIAIDQLFDDFGSVFLLSNSKSLFTFTPCILAP